jgi:two-component system KDP operon response regulator KdpE
MKGAKILAVDDDVAILRAIRRSLDAHGYEVHTLERGEPVVGLVREFKPDVILLDLVLPDVSGIEVCKRLRPTTQAAIIVLSAIGDDKKKVQALDEGADDYLTKPFSMDELLARIRVALRHGAGATREPVLAMGSLQIDIGSRRVTVGDEPIHLTPKEFELLRLLVQHRGRILTQRSILTQVWGVEYADDAHILRTFIHQLRAKLGPEARRIVNEPGVGYQMNEDPDTSRI